MMEKINNCYNKIGETMKFLPQGSWKQIVVRICKDEKHNSFGLYYQKDGVFNLIDQFVEEGKIEQQQYRNVVHELDHIASEIQDELRKNKQEVWRSLIFTLEDDGQFDVECLYDELDDDWRENAIWRYKRLGMIPSEKIMEYIKSKE